MRRASSVLLIMPSRWLPVIAKAMERRVGATRLLDVCRDLEADAGGVEVELFALVTMLCNAKKHVRHIHAHRQQVFPRKGGLDEREFSIRSIEEIEQLLLRLLAQKTQELLFGQHPQLEQGLGHAD